MRWNLRYRKTTNQQRATRRIKWKLTERIWVALVIDDELMQFKQHGSLHKQMGYDTRGNMVWPDSSIPNINPSYVMLYALPTTDFDDAKKLVEVMIAHFNKPPENMWLPLIPAAGVERGYIPSLDFSHVEAEHAVRNRVNPVQQFNGAKDE